MRFTGWRAWRRTPPIWLTLIPARRGVWLRTATTAPPKREPNTLANALAKCVRGGTGASACANLFSATNVPATPADTLAAIINVTRNPTYNPSGILGLGSSGPYAPVLSAAPTDWTMALNLTGGGLNAPNEIAIDGAWQCLGHELQRQQRDRVELGGRSGLVADRLHRRRPQRSGRNRDRRRRQYLDNGQRQQPGHGVQPPSARRSRPPAGSSAAAWPVRWVSR